MNRILTALFSALEAILVVAIGVAVPLVPLTVLWGAQYGFAPDWLIFWRTSADIWMVGHGADLSLTLDVATAKASGLVGAGTPFVVSIAALGFSLLTALLGMRAGRRIAETRHRLVGEIVAVVVVLVLSLGIALSAVQPLARVSIAQGAALPTLVFVIGLLIARLRRPEGDEGPPRDWMAGPRREAGIAIAAALRGGAAAASTIVAFTGVVIAVLLFANYARIITLYEDLHSGALGGAVLTIAQIMVLPNLVIWGVSWIVGPGFAIGTGSAVSPLGTTLGPIPAIPVLGALPHGSAAFSFAGLIVPIVAGFLAGALLRRPLVERLGTRVGPSWMLAAGAGMGVVGGAILGLLAWASAGSIGPGRLQHAGPDPWAVGLWAALEIGVPALIGMLAAGRRRSPVP
jgi:hypothetical protein